MAFLSSGLPDNVADDEFLARFLVKSNDFSSFAVKPAAFLPNPRDRETSVSRHGREPSAGLWLLGEAAAKDRTLYGAAILSAADVRNVMLDVTADEPPDRHAVITGWPWRPEDPESQKAKQKELAILLASAAGTPHLRP